MDAICEASRHIIEIVADIDDAVLGEAGCGNGAGQYSFLVAAAIGPMGVSRNMMPELCIFQAKFSGAKEICGGDAQLQAAVKILQELQGSRDNDGFNCAIFQLQFENVQIIGDDFGVFMFRQAMTREDFRDDIFIIADGIGIPVTRNTRQAIAPFKRNEEGIFLGAREFEKHAIDIKDYRRISH